MVKNGYTNPMCAFNENYGHYTASFCLLLDDCYPNTDIYDQVPFWNAVGFLFFTVNDIEYLLEIHQETVGSQTVVVSFWWFLFLSDSKKTSFKQHSFVLLEPNAFEIVLCLLVPELLDIGITIEFEDGPDGLGSAGLRCLLGDGWFLFDVLKILGWLLLPGGGGVRFLDGGKSCRRSHSVLDS